MQTNRFTKAKGLIAPSLLACDLGRLKQEVKRVEEAGADLLHIDIMDGIFVPNITFGPWILDVVRSVTSLPLDCHLMVSRPQDWILEFAEGGADTITIHLESTSHAHQLIDQIKSFGKRAGIAINPGTPVFLTEDLLDGVDVLQVMSVDPGFSGQKFIPHSLTKIAELKARRKSRAYLIEVDGGINSENIASIGAAGADIFVLGSYIFSQVNLGETISDLKQKVK